MAKSMLVSIRAFCSNGEVLFSRGFPIIFSRKAKKTPAGLMIGRIDVCAFARDRIDLTPSQPATPEIACFGHFLAQNGPFYGRNSPKTLFSDTKLGEEPVEHLLIVDLAGDLAEGAQCAAQVAGQEFRGGPGLQLSHGPSQAVLRLG